MKQNGDTDLYRPFPPMALKSVVNILAPEARGCKVVCVLRFLSEEWTLMESRWELASSVRQTNQQDFFPGLCSYGPCCPSRWSISGAAGLATATFGFETLVCGYGLQLHCPNFSIAMTDDQYTIRIISLYFGQELVKPRKIAIFRRNQRELCCFTSS